MIIGKILNFDSYIRYFLSYNYAFVPLMVYSGILSYVPKFIYFKMIASFITNKFVVLTKDEKSEISEIMESFKKKHPKINKSLMYLSLARKVSRNYICNTGRKISTLFISKLRTEAKLSLNNRYIIIPFAFKNSEYELFVPIKHEIVSEKDELYDEDENKIYRNHLQILPRLVGKDEYDKKLYHKVLNEETWEYEVKEL